MPLVQKDSTGQTVPATPISYHPNEILAQIIAEAWINESYKDKLLKNSKEVFKQAGIYVDNPKVLTEQEFRDQDHDKDANTIFVLPEAPAEVTSLFLSPPGSPGRDNLLNTARVKMAYTICGI